MKAWLLDDFAGLTALRLGDAPDPIPQEGEVVLEVHYAALNPADRYLAERQYPAKPTLPHILGRDGLGTVVQAGPGVTGLRVGDRRVILRSDIGGNRPGMFAQRVAVPADGLIEIPPGWTEPEAAGAVLVYLTAYQALTMWGPLGGCGPGVSPAVCGPGVSPGVLGQDAQATADSGRDAPATAVGQDAQATFGYNPFRPVERRQGTCLPHWTQEGATYAVSFRLFDALPADVLKQWLGERENIVKTARQMGRQLSDDERERLDRLHSERVERWLDAGHGSCFLRNASVAHLVADALHFFDNQRYQLLAWCVMPNHVHAVFRPLGDWSLSDILHSWKSYTSKKANRILGRSGDFWQDESYDHLVRNESDFEHQVRYVLENPGKAGLSNWRWLGRAPGLLPRLFPPGAAPDEVLGQDAQATAGSGRDAPATALGQDAQATVLVTGASGGVGLAAVQLAAALGCTVLALSRNLAKHERLRQLGATAVFDPGDPHWRQAVKTAQAPRRVGLAIDSIGGKLLPEVIETLGELGKVSLVGRLAGPVPNFNTATLFFRRIRLGGVAVGAYANAESRAVWQEVLRLLALRDARPQVDGVFPFDQLPQAFARLAEGPLGKVVLKVTTA